MNPATTPQALAAALRSEFSRPGYNWLTPAHPWAALLWLGRVLTRVGDAIANWLRRLLARVHATSSGAAASHPAAMRWEWVLLAGAVIVIAIAVFGSRRRHRRIRPRPVPAAAPGPATAVEAAHAVGDEHSSDAWLRLCQELERAGQYRLALRAAFLSCLARLGEQQWLRLRRGRTNRDYVREFQRRLALQTGNTTAGAHFAQAVRTFDGVWYGGQAVDAQALAGFVKLMETMETVAAR